MDERYVERNFKPSNCVISENNMVLPPSASVVSPSPWSNETVDSLEFNATIPPDLQFNENSLTIVIVYCVLFVIAAVGNLTVFITMLRLRHRKSRISLMITHLAIADLMVTFIMIPLEVSTFYYLFRIRNILNINICPCRTVLDFLFVVRCLIR